MSRPAQNVLRTLITLLQLAAFVELFQWGGAWAEVRLGIEMNALYQHKPIPGWLSLFPLLKMHVSSTLDYVANGLAFAAVLLVVIWIEQALRKRLKPWALVTLAMFLLAFVYSLLRHSGFVPLSNS